MRLHLGFELDASVVQPKGEAVIDLDISAVNGRAVVKVRDLKFNSTSSIFDLAAGPWRNRSESGWPDNSARPSMRPSPACPSRMNGSKKSK